jgi:type III pantothenate kinase
MNLIIDIGNSRVKVAVYQQRSLQRKFTFSLSEFTIAHIEEIEANYTINRYIIANSGKIDEAIVAYISSKPIHLFFDAGTPIPIQNQYASPQTLGKDRLAGVVGAKALFPSENCLVIDCGTCVTFNFITKDAIFIGGSIAPGLMMRYKAMHEYTAKLPLVNIGNIDDFIAADTENSLRVGAQMGLLFEIERFIEEYTQRFGKIRTLLTGGDADYFVKHLKNKIFAPENLTLTGLNVILNFNTQHKE